METNDYQVLELIRKYKCVPKRLLTKLVQTCDKSVNNSFLRRSLARLQKGGFVEYDIKQSAYYIPPYNQIDNNMIKALYVLTQFSNVSENYPSTNMVLISFVRNGELYEIVHLDTKTYRISVAALSANIDDNNKPKRIVIVDDDEEANGITDETLRQINCVALCAVDEKTGEIESYDFGE